ncbi:MAG: tetratricopeptide repeat protein [Myxococcales bacterium]|nr:tetratricopeptide repeat protein [Myxococcales bacterium]
MTKETQEAWRQYAIPLALEIDLEQDPQIFLLSTLTAGFAEMMRKAGFDDDLKLPLPLMRRIAKQSEFDFFLTGTVQTTDTGFRVAVDLHDTTIGTVAKHYEFSDGSFFALTDTISSEFRTMVGIDESAASSTPDLRIEELTTSHETAYRALIEGLRASIFDDDIEGALANIELAITRDPTFAVAHYRKAMLLTQHSRWAEVPAALEAIRPHNYRLTEKARNVVHVIQLWFVDKKPELALQALEQWLARTPRDVYALQLSLNLQMGQGEYKAALATLDVIETMETKLRYIGLRAQLLLADGRYEESLVVYTAYVEASPKTLAAHLGMARAAQFLGEHQAALDAYNRALAEDPSSPSVHRMLARQLYVMGRYKEAERQFQSMVKHSKTPLEVSASHSAIASYRFTRGRVELAMESLQSKWTLLAASSNDLEMHGVRMLDAPMIAQAGRRSEALQIVEGARGPLMAGDDDLGGYNFHGRSAITYSELGEIALAKDAMKKAEAIGGALSLDMRWNLPVKARIEQGEGRLESARALFREFLVANPSDAQTRRLLAEVELALGNTGGALRELNQCLSFAPFDPHTHCMMSRILASQDHMEKARWHQSTAMTVWSDADEDFSPKKLCAGVPNPMSGAAREIEYPR